MCVAKLHDINAQLVEDQGFLDLLKDLLSDSTPMVVANAVAALAEIGEVSPTGTWNRVYSINLCVVPYCMTESTCINPPQIFALYK